MLYVHLLRGDVYIPGSHYRPIDMVAENKYVIKISRNTKFSETWNCGEIILNFAKLRKN